jgi:hypothetical protein
MRLLVTFFLSLCVAFNAAYAAGTDMCDALEVGVDIAQSGHGQHLGHHDHDHASEVSDPTSPDDPTTPAAHADHCHPHQCFTSVLPGEIPFSSQTGPQVLSIGPNDPIVSHPPSRLERPPRATLA